MITGKSNPLKNGWYCVKHLATDEREAGFTWKEARDREHEFFENAPGWSAIAAECKANLGSKSLAQKLGNVLSRELQKRYIYLAPSEMPMFSNCFDSLPAIRLELDRLIRANEQELTRLPEHCPDGPRELVLQLVTRFVRDVRQQLIDGDPGAGRDGVVQKIRVQHADLRLQMQQAAPVFLPRHSDSEDVELPRPSFLPADEIWLSKSALGNEYTVEEVAEDAEWSVGFQSQMCSGAETIDTIGLALENGLVRSLSITIHVISQR
jgi:hypothetical protein